VGSQHQPQKKYLKNLFKISLMSSNNKNQIPITKKVEKICKSRECVDFFS